MDIQAGSVPTCRQHPIFRRNLPSLHALRRVVLLLSAGHEFSTPPLTPTHLAWLDGPNGVRSGSRGSSGGGAQAYPS